RRSKTATELTTLARDEEEIAGLARDLGEWQALRDRIAALKVLQPEYSALREALARMDERFAQTERRVQENRADIEEVEEKARHLEALEAGTGEYDALLTRDEVLVRAAGYAREEERCLREARAASDEMSRLQNTIAGLSRQLAGMDTIEERIEAAGSRKDSLTSRISACAARRQTVCEEIQRLTEHRTEILEAGPEGSCPMCHQGLGEHYEDLLGDLVAGIRSMQEVLVSLEEEHAQATAGHREVVAALQDLMQQRTAFQRTKEQHALHTSRYEQGVETVRRWQAEAGEHHAAIEALGLERYDPAAHEALRRRLSDLAEKRARADTLRGECSRLPALMEERQRLIAGVEDHLTRKEETEGRLARLGFDPEILKRLETEAQALEASYHAYTEAQARLARRPALEEEEKEILERLDGLRMRLQEIEDEQRDLAFDPDRFLRLAEEFGRVKKAHRKTLELRVRLEEVPRLQKMLGAKQELLASRETELRAAKAAIAGLGFDEQAIAEVENRLSGLEGDLMKARERRYAAAAAISSLKADIGEEVSRLSRADELAREQETLHEEIGRLKLTRSIIKDYTDYLLQVVRDRIEEEAGRVLAEITDGRYGTVMLDDDFTVLVHDMGDDYPADRFSGGEQDDIAIALRIALSRFLAGVNEMHDSTFLIFDEIFGSQDEERRNNLLRALRTQEAHFPQILLISHITEVQDEFSTTFLVEMGADGASMVRGV
ncbi:MAG: SMC family ATPase, partial [Methanomicrobiales archaeon]|nr:SMC family ATPase [Methanomicrobiales archaeon]